MTNPTVQQADGLTFSAYPGDGAVLLAFDIDQSMEQDLADTTNRITEVNHDLQSKQAEAQRYPRAAARQLFLRRRRFSQFLRPLQRAREAAELRWDFQHKVRRWLGTEFPWLHSDRPKEGVLLRSELTTGPRRCRPV